MEKNEFPTAGDGTPTTNANPKIMLDIRREEGVDAQMASMLANHMVNICLNESLIIIPDTSEEIEIQVYVKADGGVSACYEEQEVSMMSKVLCVDPADILAALLLGTILGGFGDFGDATHEGEPKTPVS